MEMSPEPSQLFGAPPLTEKHSEAQVAVAVDPTGVGGKLTSATASTVACGAGAGWTVAGNGARARGCASTARAGPARQQTVAVVAAASSRDRLRIEAMHGMGW